MTSLAHLIEATVFPSIAERRPPRMTRLVRPLEFRPLAKPTAEFERRCFNFLHAHRGVFGIAEIFLCKNLVIDGLVRLQDGRFILVEVKYRLNWSLACRTEWQFRQFQQTPTGHDYPARHAIVVFEEFSADWAKPVGGIESGWRNWYRDYYWPRDRRSIRLSLVRFSGGRLLTAPPTVVRTRR